MLLIHGLHPVPLRPACVKPLKRCGLICKATAATSSFSVWTMAYGPLRLVGHCKSCPSSAVTLELALKQAIEEACPDLLGFECEESRRRQPNHESHIPNAAPSWSVLELQELKDGELVPVHAGGVPLVLYKTEGRLYAYRDHVRPATCRSTSAYSITLLSCRAGHRYDVQRAGRAAGFCEPSP